CYRDWSSDVCSSDLLIEKYPRMSGLYHISGEPISKYALLQLMNEIYRLDVKVEREDDVVCDRSLDSTRFRQATGWRPKPWRAMIDRKSTRLNSSHGS